MFRGLRVTLIALAALAATLVGSAVAEAAISGRVQNTAGVPLAGVYITVNDAGGGFADSEVSNGNGAFTTGTLAGGPFTFVINTTDSCRSYGDPKHNVTLSQPGIADPTSGLVLTIDMLDFCAGSPPSYTDPPATGLVDGVARRIVAPPGGLVYVSPQLPYDATNISVSLGAGGPVIGTGTASYSSIPLNLPAAYNGPLALSFTSSSTPFSRDMGTLLVQAPSPATVKAGVPVDVEAIVDISGSMSFNDPKFLRKDALNLLADLSGSADGLGAVGFDDAFQPISDLVRTSSQAVINLFKARVRTRVVNRGGTDYNIGMDRAWDALTAPGVDPNRQKLIIFLTDGGHNVGPYNNGHLRFAMPGAFNGVTQRTWPVCVIQLGAPSGFQAGDVARLKRIASETGGKYFATQSGSRLADIYFKCRGQGTGQQAILSRSFVFSKANQQRRFLRRLKKNLRQATFFVSSGGTFTFQLALRDPRGHLITQVTHRSGVVFRRGKTFAFFRITRPRAGTWRVIVTSKRIISTSGRGQVTISVPTR